MASKKTKTDNELDELFSSLGDDSGTKKSHPKPKTSASKARADQAEKDKDILAELENQLGDQPAARPHTPRLSKDLAGSKRTSTQTPPPGAVAASGRQSEDNKPAANLPRKSVDSARSLHASFTPSATSSDLQDAEKKGTVEQNAPAPAAGGGWWGGIFATATATASAVAKQAEVVYKDIQHNEDAKKYLELARDNVGVIRGYGEFYYMSDFLPELWYRAPKQLLLLAPMRMRIGPGRNSTYQAFSGSGLGVPDTSLFPAFSCHLRLILYLYSRR